MYAELHARSAFSFLEGASLPEDLVHQCAQLKIPAIALVDTDNVSGAPRFYMAAKKLGIQPHMGAEITAAAGGRYTLLVENRTGYQNLCRLISSMKLRSEKGKAAASEAEFRQYASGLIALADGSQPFEKLIDIYGPGNVYAEVQRHLIRSEEAANERVRELALQWKIPVIATNGVRFTNPQKRPLMDVLTCTRHKTNVMEAGRLLEHNAERYLKSPAAMRRLFKDTPEAIDRALELSSRLRFTLADLGYEFPRYPVPSGETMDSYLRAQTLKGALGRYGAHHEKAYRQIERELALIEKLKLSGYFLIVWDIVDFCRNQGILVQGRGSAANSAVCYSLGITAIDPVKMELLFERFLSEERGEWPDIDIDLPSGDDREEAIQYVYERYGKLGAAMTANVITYRSRSAVRDVGKALGFDLESLERISKLSSRGAWEVENPGVYTQDKQFRAAGFDLNNPLVGKLHALSREILSLPRHLGQHSGGMVICQGQLNSIVPIEPATMPGRVIVQWDKEDCADLGLIKIDLLGLGMMAALKDSITLIRDHYHEEVDLAKLPPDDKEVYDVLQKADTVGLFQVESRAQMSSLPRLKPANFYDIVVQVAIIRPGPIVGKMMHPYLRRREGEEDPVCLHSSLEPVLHRTLGVPLFQEQLLRMAMIVADFTGGEAEELRRAMGFKRSEERMIDIEARLRSGMEKKGITGEVQNTIVQAITAFALYGFPESHAASFALIAYASAYLKCHYLAAFTAALLNNQPMGFYSAQTLVKDAQRHGLHFLPVDVTQSDWKCRIADSEPRPNIKKDLVVRLGFNYVKGFSENTALAIVARRPFKDIDDLRDRVPEISKDEMTALADLGALNQVGGQRHRRDALWQSALALRPVGELLKDAGIVETPSPLAAMNPIERLQADFANSGLSIGSHPMRFHRERLNTMHVIPAAQVKNMPDGRFIRVAGAVICRQQPGTAKGFVFLSLEDETGIANVILKPDVFERLRVPVLNSSYLIVDGILQNQRGVASIKATDVRPCVMPTTAVAASHDFH
ncbi:MAG TPA: error-prone DNA polymerase [Bryobacteraceae bacterium]|jgi:error-prone DNA polymerase|nr:error-prone DNA polymerase [Bryobacteraceae bacterium]